MGAECLADAERNYLVTQLQDVDGTDTGRQEDAESLGGMAEIGEDRNRVRHMAFAVCVK